MLVLADGPLAPAIIVFPFAIIVLLVLAVHAAVLFRTDMPPSRKRIRLANAALMLFTTPVIAYGFGWIDPAVHKRPFVVTWTLVAGLVVLILFLALFDAVNNLRIQRAELRNIRRESFKAASSSPDAAT
ncbi:MAG: hypothetical protein PSX37_07235 [bacterium]|nr:hypothetical protein [bacterium]